jgi:uncharacterized UBP type Zn finger protein
MQTDVTMTELEIDMNMRIGEWSIIQESGKQLVPCYGQGYTGMHNLGNSCYLNSIMQVLFSLPQLKHRLEVRMACDGHLISNQSIGITPLRNASSSQHLLTPLVTSRLKCE